MIFQAVLSCVLVVLTVVWFYRQGIRSGKNYPKGPWGFPVLGHLPFLGALPTETFRKWSEKYGNVFMIRLGSWKTVVVNGEKAIKEIASRKDAFSGRPPFGTRDIMKEVYGGIESLGFTNFDSSYLLHKKLAKAGLRVYTHERVNELKELVVEESIKMVDNILKQREDNVSFFQELATLNANILFQLFYGKGNDALKSQKIKAMLDAHDDFADALKSGNVVDVLPWLKYVIPSAAENVKKMVKTYHSAARENIDEHIKSFDGQNIRDLTDVFLATKLEDTTNDVDDDDKNKCKSISRERLLYTLLDLFAAGMLTTSSALRWLFLYMIEFPEVQQRVFEEINNTIGQNRCIEWGDHLNLPYTNATLKEAMRIRPTSAFGLSQYTIEDTQLDNLDIDKDTVVMINFHSVSQDPKFWGDPQNFRPERYLLDNGELDPVKIKHEVTFGIGRRTCAGEDLAKKALFLIFSTMIQKYVFSKPESAVSNFEPVVGITYSPKPYKTVVKERL